MKLLSVVVRVGLGASLVVGAGGCAGRQHVAAESESRPSESLGEYYPLAVGNRWTYRVNGRADRTVDVEVLKEEDGYFHDNQGGQLAVDGFGIRDRKRYLLRGPLAAGTEWTNVVSVSSTERYRILQSGVPCEAPAGSFQHCVRVEARNRVDATTTLVNALTFAEGVGLVRVEVSAEKSNGERVPQTWLELASYKLQGSGS
ncbi:hypothetical protein [Vitiosangium sp. GDMCC 1.1324]|uniref:hypothetical protein n=1 Tax=Vitiosangium sp. (strain GDMCC 1.1324) TaxID=2138576 RepID=UPI000D39FA63|nr:hypothetical protein [Vitiosangium sp. GDMCC 1.1324]PTL85349.1 hypothetical protein DAT35_01095 [Vitiosangium sp. GDMCC 1.1324]